MVAALWLFAAPMLLLALPGQWLPPQPGLPWDLIGQVLASGMLLCIFAWLAHLQPTLRRRWFVALILGLWVLAVPLLEAIQMYTPIAVDELF